MNALLKDLNRRFDHAALKPEVTEVDIVRLCKEAREYELFAVCVNPVWVARCREELALSSVRIVSVAGFPLGANRTDVKVDEAVRAVADGAHEIDMVANIGSILDGRMTEVAREIRAVRDALAFNVVLKVIIEAGLLSRVQMEAATRAVIDGGAQFVKTSTGFFGGATVEQVRNLARAAEGKVAVKASGGIRTAADCLAMIEAGAERLGSSSSVAIMRGIRVDDGRESGHGLQPNSGE